MVTAYLSRADRTAALAVIRVQRGKQGAVVDDESLPDGAVARLVGELYDASPVTERCRLLDRLLPSMGVLSLVAVANGVFAQIRLRNDWASAHVRIEDVQKVQAVDVAALVDRLQQTRVEAVDGLAEWVMASPVLAGSTAAVLLLTMLIRRSHLRGLRASEDGAHQFGHALGSQP